MFRSQIPFVDIIFFGGEMQHWYNYKQPAFWILHFFVFRVLMCGSTPQNLRVELFDVTQETTPFDHDHRAHHAENS